MEGAPIAGAVAGGGGGPAARPAAGVETGGGVGVGALGVPAGGVAVAAFAFAARWRARLAAGPKASPKHVIITNRCIYNKYESRLYHYVK